MEFLKYLVLLGAIYSASTEGYSWWKRYQVEQSLHKLGRSPQSYGLPEMCRGKKYCVIVYVAPWCMECRRSLQSFYALQRFLPRLRPEVGFGFVIGGAKLPELMKMKAEFRDFEVSIDETGFFAKYRTVQAFPFWLVTDSFGKEIYRTSGGFYASTLGEVNQALVDFLKL